eukprot:CAMPEP_0119106054 /NCGR_PEP_ID=MMETSP1180-20130426/3858_1 /TAXON_ID=3052 ORGANISM="Chlamydomonas cf sp, Strain CCMP681" /NCGR_SAMPLE_ID=MMETSP1180 /ASSEMBLY_ACC=CAM_ASM_000741 /LENGTH=182 /DNA_ID=CAMNT_0007091287 /DNA_START=32 /DNA_END=581 /DNA_ORIENTATION=+
MAAVRILTSKLLGSCNIIGGRPAPISSARGQTRGICARASPLTPPEDENKPKTVLLREEEPDEYWVSKSEKAGANPLKDPMAIVGIVSILLPFIFLLIAVATGKLTPACTDRSAAACAFYVLQCAMALPYGGRSSCAAAYVDMETWTSRWAPAKHKAMLSVMASAEGSCCQCSMIYSPNFHI